MKKPALEPARLGAGWILIDAAAVTGKGSGPNELRVDEVRIVREPMDTGSGTLPIEGDITLDRSREYRGGLLIRPGATVKVTAPRFRIYGDITVEDASLEFAGGVFDLVQRFQHERTIRLKGNARLSFRDALVFTHFPANLKLEGNASVSMERTECVGGFTCDVPQKGRVSLSKTKSPGEFVITPGGTVDVADCENVILWHTLAANLKGALRFPGRAIADWRVPAPDRELRFRRTTVAAWNVYASDNAVIRVKKSTIGEAMTFGKGRIELENTTVDGRGGYVGAHDDSVIRLVRCKITCLVVAHKCSKIELVECEVTGDVRAIDAGRVKFVKTAVSGKVEADSGAAIERE